MLKCWQNWQVSTSISFDGKAPDFSGLTRLTIVSLLTVDIINFRAPRNKRQHVQG